MNESTRTPPLWARIAGGTGYVLLCCAALTAGTAAGWMSRGIVTNQATWDLTHKGRLSRPLDNDVFDGKEQVNLLLLGCDVDLSIGGKKVLQKQARSDMMLVAHLDFKANTITGLSIQRDTLCALPGYKEQKINAYHSIGVRKSDQEGMDLARQAVETILPPVKIDRVLVLNYDALQEMVALVGGVDLFVDKKMDYDDRAGNLHVHFKPGQQHLDGYQSMAFVRFRHSDDDWHRTERQKQFLLAFKDAALKHWTSLADVADKAREGIGNALSASEIIALAGFAKGVGQENIKIGGVPVVVAGEYTYHVDSAKLPAVLAEYHFTDGYTAQAADTRMPARPRRRPRHHRTA